MKRCRAFRNGRNRKPEVAVAEACLICGRRVRPSGWAAVFLAACLALATACPARAQVAEAGNAGGLSISAGAMGSGFYLQYGERKMLGIAAFVDADTRRRIGVEAEGRWLRFHETAGVNAATYLIGARYHLDFWRLQIYAKGLVGEGQFNFPYGYAHGNYLVIAPGAGVDYPLTRRFSWRVDAEYQDWPQFTFGAMSSYGVSTGFRVRVF